MQAQNVLESQFKAGAPNRKWVADLAYIWTAKADGVRWAPAMKRFEDEDRVEMALRRIGGYRVNSRWSRLECNWKLEPFLHPDDFEAA